MSAELDPIRLVDERAWIRVYNFQGDPYAEGRVIAYCDQPTIVVEGANGERAHCPVVMRWERAPEPAPAEPPVEATEAPPKAYTQPPVTFEFAIENSRRLLQWAEQNTDRQLMERYEKLADSWIGVAALALQRERGEA